MLKVAMFDLANAMLSVQRAPQPLITRPRMIRLHQRLQRQRLRDARSSRQIRQDQPRNLIGRQADGVAKSAARDPLLYNLPTRRTRESGISRFNRD